MKVLKRKIWDELLQIEAEEAATPNDRIFGDKIDEVYMLAKTLHYIDKACELYEKEGKSSNKIF
jgi:hypothetical protein